MCVSGYIKFYHHEPTRWIFFLIYLKFLHGEDRETIWPNQEIPLKIGLGQKNRHGRLD